MIRPFVAWLIFVAVCSSDPYECLLLSICSANFESSPLDLMSLCVPYIVFEYVSLSTLHMISRTLLLLNCKYLHHRMSTWLPVLLLSRVFIVLLVLKAV
jgi:hypothetical protein